MDKRLQQYVETILDLIEIKKGELVWVNGPVVAKEMLLELQKGIIDRGAFADMDVYFEESVFNRLQYSTEEQLSSFGPVDKARTDRCDKRVLVWSLDDYVVDYAKLSPEKLGVHRRTREANMRRLDGILSAGVEYPTPWRAKKSGMAWEEYLDFFYGAVNIDLRCLYEKYRWLEDKINRGREIRLIGPGTDLSMGIQGRSCVSDETFFWNLPDGELFTSPVEDSVEGIITFEHKQVYMDSVPVEDLILRFKEGKLVAFSASRGEEFFKNTVETDMGACRLGELGIGINPGVDRITNYDLFDEKIFGTVHIALGDGFAEAGGQNRSAVHWDLVKDLRVTGKILLDGETIFANGQWIV